MEHNTLNQYLGIIKPNTSVTSDAMSMKIRCKNDHAWDSAVYSKPHFTVFDIIQPVLNEERLTQSFERNIEKISPFQIELHGFNYFFSKTYTLYAKVKEEKEFSEMARYIRKFSNPILKSVKAHPPHYIIKNAHLTIAKGILASEFLTAWQSWKNTEYHASTTAERIVLLRRPFTYVNFKYEVIGEYPLLGKGMLNPQRTLF